MHHILLSVVIVCQLFGGFQVGLEIWIEREKARERQSEKEREGERERERGEERERKKERERGTNPETPKHKKKTSVIFLVINK